MIDGQKIGQLDVAVNVAAEAVGIDVGGLKKVAESTEIEKRCRESTAV